MSAEDLESEDFAKSQENEKGMALPAEEIPRGGKADPAEGDAAEPAD